jgi:hypothetical protein
MNDVLGNNNKYSILTDMMGIIVYLKLNISLRANTENESFEYK